MGDSVGLCIATYDEPRRGVRSDTHTCALTDGHEGLHECDLCGTHWMARTGVRLPAGAEREQVGLARQDAMVTGTGFVMITQDADGFHYERVEPVRVMVKSRPKKSGREGTEDGELGRDADRSGSGGSGSERGGSGDGDGRG